MMALAILQARMSSTRLPGKVMKDLLGQPMIGRQIERVRRAQQLSGLVVATSTGADDDRLADWCAGAGVEVFRGDLDDVLSRYLGALEAMGWPEHFVRLTADCPLADPALIDYAVSEHIRTGADYTHVQGRWTFPKGLDVEVCRTAVLRRVGDEATGSDREHVTRLIYTHPERFKVHAIHRDPPLRYRWTVDTPEDFAFVQSVYADLYPTNPAFSSEDVLAWQARHPDRVLANTDA
jgi:spore coat polysaccharide biosynthesis protein SpsF